jgi:hypothetical protein
MWLRVSTCVVLMVAFLQPLPGRFIVGGQTFQEMLDKSDLVVIATALKSKDSTERKKLIDIDVINTTAPEQLQDEVIGVETEFQTRVTLKGPKDVTKFLLHHYRWTLDEEVANGPNFIQIPSQRHGTFLMFLAREKDGRYAPVTGQFDPAVLSIFEIKDATPDKPVW